METYTITEVAKMYDLAPSTLTLLRTDWLVTGCGSGE